MATSYFSTQLGQKLGRPFAIHEFHHYKYVVKKDGEGYRASFLIDGVELPLKDQTINFGDEPDRRIHLVNAKDVADTDIIFDNLMLTVEP